MTTTTPIAALEKLTFPIFQTDTWKNLVYLDSAATTQKPLSVIESIHQFYMHDYGTVRRGVYRLSAKATQAYEETREKIAKLIHANSSDEVIYTSGTTESINLVAYSYGMEFLTHGDEIILSELEHHANIVPWQLVCKKKGCVIKVIPALDNGTLDMDAYKQLLGPKTRFVSVAHVSNALGTVHPIAEIIALAHKHGAVVLIDAAQSIAHHSINVNTLDCDFMTFSGHKMYGPTGIGVLFGKKELLELMPPFKGGGDMIEKVSFEKTTFQAPPHRFEAGTPAIAEVIGLGKAVDFLWQIGMDNIHAHEQALLKYGTNKLSEVTGLTLIGTAANKGGILSFVLDGVHPHDIGTMLDERGIAIRAGHHCAQPAMNRYGVPATARASMGIYNSSADLDKLATALAEIHEIFSQHIN